MGSGTRKLGLAAHVVSSVGWLGAVAAFLALGVAGLTGRDPELVRGAYSSMNLIGLAIIVPFSILALLTGLVQSLGTTWGLFRHYWVVAKLVLTVGATALLFLHQFTAVAEAARRAAGAAAGTFPDVGRLGIQLVVDAGLAILVLAAITTLAICKPWGRIPDRRSSEAAMTGATPLGLKVFMAVVGAAVAGAAVLHVAGRGLGGHGG